MKGLAAGATNLTPAFAGGAALPGAGVAAAMAVGFVAYGVSLALFVLGLRQLGASRAGANFSTSPFVGALFLVLFLAEPITWQLLAAATLMGLGVWLHLTEQHVHAHHREALEHEHPHTHDMHHLHDHASLIQGQHSHRHHPGGVRNHCIMVKMVCFACCMGVSSYVLCSNMRLLQLRHLPSRHSGRHRITGPAEQGQQGNHENEEQMAHAIDRRLRP